MALGDGQCTEDLGKHDSDKKSALMKGLVSARLLLPYQKMRHEKSFGRDE